MPPESDGAVHQKFASAITLGDELDRKQMLANLRRKIFSEEEEAPSKIGRFEVVGRLGAGASGVVFAALDPQLERKVAIKLLRTDTRGDPESGRARLLREAKTLARISHPHIVGVHEVGEFDGRVFIAMEYVEGQTLARWIASGPHPWAEVVKLFLQAGRGIAAAHEAGLVHRDFKPENVLLDNVGHVRVADFGLARLVDSPATASELAATLASNECLVEAPGLTATGTLVGTPAYMAPERFSGGEATAVSDQFSFGVALNEALCGVRPFGGRTLAELAANIASGQRQAQPEASVPRWLDRIVERSLSTDPARRYPSMGVLLGELGRERRGGRGLLLAGIGVAGIGIVAYGFRGDSAGPCVSAGTELAAHWNPNTQTEILQAFEGTGHPDATAQFGRVRVLLDQSVARWEQLSHEACIAAHGNAPPPPHVADRRALCLDHVRYAIEASVETFRDASTVDVVAAAPLMAPELAQLELCGGDDVVLAALAPPPVPEKMPLLREIQKDLARADSLRLAGEGAAALALGQELVARAQALDYPPLEAEAQSGLGTTYTVLTQPEEAADAFRQSIAAADRGRADRIRANALAALARKEADLGRLDEARTALEQADAAFSRTGLDARYYPAQIAIAHAWVAEAGGELDAASSRFFEVAEHSRGDPAMIEVHVTALSGLGRIRLEKRELASALEVLSEAVATATAALGASHPLVGQLLVNLGAAELRLGNVANAEAALSRSLEIRRVYMPEDDPQLADLYANLGAIAFSQGEYDRAIERFDLAGRVAARQRPDHPVVSVALFNKASALSRKGRYAEALVAQERVLELRLVAHGEIHRKTASARTALGMTLLELKRYDEATEQLVTARSSMLELVGPDHADLLWTLTGLAEAYLATGALEAAAATIAASSKPAEGEAVSPESRSALAYVTARILVAQGKDLARALELGRQANTWAREAGLDERAEEIARWLADQVDRKQ